MNLMITNDDGWDAPGLNTLVNAAQNFGNVWVVAPATHMSGISHQVTWKSPIAVHEKSSQVFAVEGTPADCVRIGTSQMEVEFDWILSGINNGGNMGTDIFLSGTVAATREAVLLGYPSIAFSQHRLNIADDQYDWKAAEMRAQRTLQELMTVERQQLKNGTNVNFPDRPWQDTQQIELVECELDRTPLPVTFSKNSDGHFVPTGEYNQRHRTSGSDVDTCFGGSISITDIGLK